MPIVDLITMYIVWRPVPETFFPCTQHNGNNQLHISFSFSILSQKGNNAIQIWTLRCDDPTPLDAAFTSIELIKMDCSTNNNPLSRSDSFYPSDYHLSIQVSCVDIVVCQLNPPLNPAHDLNETVRLAGVDIQETPYGGSSMDEVSSQYPVLLPTCIYY